MNWKNKITDLLHIEYPIIQAPMFGVATPEMVTAATSIGCLGSLPLGDLSAQNCTEKIRQTKALSNRPFAVNIFVNEIPEISEALKLKYDATKNFIESLVQKYNLNVRLPAIDEIKLTDYHEQVEAIIAENCKVVSFTFGNLDVESIQKFKANDTILIGTCTSVEEAQILEKSGIDVICVQGIEAGGHRGSFTSEDILTVGGLSLLPQVCENVTIPVTYAGGVYNANTLLAAKLLGAEGFQIGSLLLASEESALKEFEKERLKNVSEEEIVLTKSFSGRYARGIRNAFTEAVEKTDYILPYPYQNKLTSELRTIAKKNEALNFVSIWMGQSIHPFSQASTSVILSNLIKEVENIRKDF